MVTKTRAELEILVTARDEAANKLLDLRQKALKDMKKGIGKEKEALAIQNQRLKMDEEGFHKAHRFRMELLSIMFGMMAIQRILNGFLKSAIQTYKQASENQGEFLELTNRLSAAWIFLKFRLIDALGKNDLFKAAIEGIIHIIDLISGLDDKAMGKIAIALVAIAGAVTVASFAASMGLLIGGLKLFTAEKATHAASMANSMKILSTIGAVTMAVVISGWILGDDFPPSTKALIQAIAAGLSLATIAIGGGVGLAIALPVVMALGAKIANEKFNSTAAVVTAIATALGGIAGLLVGGPVLAGVGALIGFGVSLVINEIIWGNKKGSKTTDMIKNGEVDFNSLYGLEGPSKNIGNNLEAVGQQMTNLISPTEKLSSYWGMGDAKNFTPVVQELSNKTFTLNEELGNTKTNLSNVESDSRTLANSLFDLNDVTITLTENTNAEGDAHYYNANAINAEASAIRNLIEALEDLAETKGGGGSKSKTKSSP